MQMGHCIQAHAWCALLQHLPSRELAIWTRAVGVMILCDKQYTALRLFTTDTQKTLVKGELTGA